MPIRTNSSIVMLGFSILSLGSEKEVNQKRKRERSRLFFFTCALTIKPSLYKLSVANLPLLTSTTHNRSPSPPLLPLSAQNFISWTPFADIKMKLDYSTHHRSSQTHRHHPPSIPLPHTIRRTRCSRGSSSRCTRRRHRRAR